MEEHFPIHFIKVALPQNQRKPVGKNKKKRKRKHTGQRNIFMNIHKNHDQTMSKQNPVIKAYPGAISGSVPYNHNKASITRQNFGFPSAYQNYNSLLSV